MSRFTSVGGILAEKVEEGTIIVKPICKGEDCDHKEGRCREEGRCYAVFFVGDNGKIATARFDKDKLDWNAESDPPTEIHPPDAGYSKVKPEGRIPDELNKYRCLIHDMVMANNR